MADLKPADTNPAIASEPLNTEAHLRDVATEALAFFENTAGAAAGELEKRRTLANDVFVSPNSFTKDAAVKSLTRVDEERVRALTALRSEPAIARLVVTEEDGSEQVLYIARTAPAESSPGRFPLVSYKSPVGRLASLSVGAEEEVRTPTRTRSFTVRERATLHPSHPETGWDSLNSIAQSESYGPLTIRSLRALLSTVSSEAAERDILSQLLSDEEATANIRKGLSRNVILKMGLRDQPLLDQVQDEIFRLPLDSQLLVLGPPGSGKTTTLIKRLGQKVDLEYLNADEREVVGRSAAGAQGHNRSWLLFTPTELLKQYVKEAFNREGIPAPDQRIQTWSDYRREIARNRLGLLRGPAAGGTIVMSEKLEGPRTTSSHEQREWFTDFFTWQQSAFWEELTSQAQLLVSDSESEIANLGQRVLAKLSRSGSDARVGVLVDLVLSGDEFDALIASQKAKTDSAIRKTIAAEVGRDTELLDRLALFLENLGETPDDQEESEDDDESPVTQRGRSAAYNAYTQAVRAHARAALTGRTVGRQTRNAKVFEWLGSRDISQADLRDIGLSLRVQDAARRFANPLRAYIQDVPRRYRRFRRESQNSGKWYSTANLPPMELHPLELDAVLLAMLRTGRELLKNRQIASNIESPRCAPLRILRNLFQTQIVVDEATDFSPIQLACMGSLCDPSSDSFFACGDFNQRLTPWGSSTVSDFAWVYAGIDVRTFSVTYRHSQQLNDLALALASLSSPSSRAAQLPAHVDSSGVDPVLGVSLTSRQDVATWLSERLAEIERFSQSFPSIAVLVNDEGEIEPLSIALNAALSRQNVRAVPCPGGLTKGQDNDVRVFSVEHIKGLEFEALFFVGVDRLAAEQPELFDKYLYVGATRAATYLGLTTSEPQLPRRIAELAGRFVADWD